MFDEAHHVASAGPVRQRHLLNAFKVFSGEAQVSVLLAGKPELRAVVTADEQISRRTRILAIPRLDADRDALKGALVLLGELERVTPLRRPSGLKDKVLADRLVRLADGVLGEVRDLVELAALAALGGEERVSLALVDRLVESGAYVPVKWRRE